MNDHLSVARLNDLVDGLLPAAEVASAKAHVEVCAVCREEYARISETVRELRSLPKSADAPDTVWSAVEGRISSSGDTVPGATGDHHPGVVPLREPGRAPWRVTLSVSQLTAAAIVVSLLSATTAWVVVTQGGAGSASVAVEEANGASEVRSVSAEVANEAAEYDAAITDLEEILDRGRMLLSRETLVTLETSLEVIDEAINEVQAALERDPASELLLRVLMTHQRTKLHVLRQAATSLHFRS
jgi:anti-sigma factor RsiW